jgi:hypothetical protein
VTVGYDRSGFFGFSLKKRWIDPAGVLDCLIQTFHFCGVRPVRIAIARAAPRL